MAQEAQISRKSGEKLKSTAKVGFSFGTGKVIKILVWEHCPQNSVLFLQTLFSDELLEYACPLHHRLRAEGTKPNVKACRFSLKLGPGLGEPILSLPFMRPPEILVKNRDCLDLVEKVQPKYDCLMERQTGFEKQSDFSYC